MICPNLRCGQTVIAPDAARGRLVRCGRCQQMFVVPPKKSDAPPPVETPATGKKKK
jgi:hypothetical protein